MLRISIICQIQYYLIFCPERHAKHPFLPNLIILHICWLYTTDFTLLIVFVMLQCNLFEKVGKSNGMKWFCKKRLAQEPSESCTRPNGAT